MFGRTPAKRQDKLVDSFNRIGFDKAGFKKKKDESKQEASFDSSEYDYFLHIGVLGPSGSGKTALSAALVDAKYDSVKAEHDPHLFLTGATRIDGKICKFHLSMRHENIYQFKGKRFFFLTFDLTNRSSFEQLKKDIEIVLREAADGVQFVLVGTHLDKVNPEKPVISDSEIIDFASEYAINDPLAGLGNSRCVGVSKVNALDGTNVKDTLHMAISAFLQKSNNLHLVNEKSQSMTAMKADEKKIEISERETINNVLCASTVDRRNTLICEWLQDKSHNLKDKAWGSIRADSLKILLSEVKQARSASEKFDLLSDAIKMPLFNKHRQGKYGDTSTVTKIKKEMKKYAHDAELEKEKLNAHRHR